MQAHEAHSTASSVVAPAPESRTTEMLTLEELLDVAARRLNSTDAASTHLSIIRALATAPNDSSTNHTVALAAIPAYSGKVVATSASTEGSTEATAPVDHPAMETFLRLSSPFRGARSRTPVSRSPPRGSVAVGPTHSLPFSKGAARSEAPLSELVSPPANSPAAAASGSPTPHLGNDATTCFQARTNVSIVPHIPIPKKTSAKAEASQRTPRKAASYSSPCTVRQSVGGEHSLSTATLSKLACSGSSVTTAYIAALLRGILGASNSAGPATADTCKRCAVSTETPRSALHDLPVGLLLLYCAAEETCTAVKNAAVSSGHFLLDVLEQISDVRRRDRRRAALLHASELERSKCEELYEAAIKKRASDAAKQAARAQALELEELRLCTFNRAPSKKDRRMGAKGTKKFIKRCLEWKAATERRLRQKCDHLAEVQAEQRAAAAAKSGIPVAGGVVTKRSLRLLAQPRVQERLKSRPCLWEAKRPCKDLQEGEVGVLVPAHALAATTSISQQQFGEPVTSSTAAEQDAVLRAFRRFGNEAAAAGEPSPLLLQNTSVSRPSKSGGGDAVRGFLSRVAEDAERREKAAASLQTRFRDPDLVRFEAGTGKPLFRPNALPAAWKDGHRVSYDDLSKEEQQEFREELRRSGLDFVLRRYLRERRGCEKWQSVPGRIRGSPPAPQGDDADGADTANGGATPEHSPLSHLQKKNMTEAHQTRFMASLEAAVVRKKKNWEGILAEATAQETFHPQISQRSAKMALHKTGGTPIYARSVNPKKEPNTEDVKSRRSSDPLPSSASRDQPLSERVEFFLARNTEWMESRQRRLQHLTEMEEERHYAGCTFTPNRDFTGTSKMSEPRLGVEGGLARSSAKPGSVDAPYPRGGNAAGCRGSSESQMRPQDVMASAADVRVMNELELLRSGSAYRDENFLKAVCERSGLTDPKRAMANLSLHSAPRLTGNRKGGWGISSPHHLPVTSLSQSPLSPIPHRDNTPSASPYALMRRNTFSPSSSLHRCAPMHSQREFAQTPARQSVAGDAAAARSRIRGSASSSRPLTNPWAVLDAQIDAVLRYEGP
ncbi:hypothetical protein JKF63_02646 [Porcisia hertigi]|uniref:Uncharacterized protein n=1 Tax=Porcisia hertigi TaxID=2761500 RepID=A0A836HRL2_9TRYP|nr:hypothetical protein JKF63_02646 [Porcisia hertigi]